MSETRTEICRLTLLTLCLPDYRPSIYLFLITLKQKRFPNQQIMGTKRKRNYPTMTTKAGYALLSSCGMFIESVPRTKREENGHFNGNDQQQVINDHPQEEIIAMAHTGAHHRRHDVAVFSSSPSSAMSDPCHCNNSNGNGCGHQHAVLVRR